MTAKVIHIAGRQLVPVWHFGRAQPLEVNSIESEDILSAALSEVKKGYDIIFLPREKKKLFPLFERTLPGYLQKKISGRIVLC